MALTKKYNSAAWHNYDPVLPDRQTYQKPVRTVIVKPSAKTGSVTTKQEYSGNIPLVMVYRG